MLTTERAVVKGDVIFTDQPVVCCEDRLVIGGKRRCLICGWCGGQAGTWSQRASAVLGQGRKGAVLEPKTVLPVLPDLPNLPQEATVCNQSTSGCDEVFCSQGCAAAAARGSGMHAMVCAGMKEVPSPFVEFRRHARRNREALILAAGLAGEATAELRDRAGDRDDGSGRATGFALELVQGLLPSDHPCESDPTIQLWWMDGRGNGINSGEKEEEDGVMGEDMQESALLLKAALHDDLCPLSALDSLASPTPPPPNTSSASPLSQPSAAASALLHVCSDPPRYVSFLRRVHALLLRIPVPSPLVPYTQALPTAPPDTQAAALAALSPVARSAIAQDGKGASPDPSGASPAQERSTLGGAQETHGHVTPGLARLFRGMPPARVACRLAQACLDRDPASNPLGVNAGALLTLLPRVAQCRHSCAPNALLEATWLEAPPGAAGRAQPAAAEARLGACAGGGSDGGSGDGEEAACGGAGRWRVGVSVVALRDIGAGEGVSISTIDHGLPLPERAAQLKARYGAQFRCECVRCEYERGKGSGLGVESLRALGDLAMQQQRHHDAYAAYDAILSRDTGDGEALYARAAARLEGLRWREAHSLFRQGARLAPQHRLLAATEAKRRAYELPPHPAHLPFTLPPFRSFLGGRAFETLGALPVVSAEECRFVIEETEAHAAARGGWTTARHYAVPTTDIPVHHIPKVLSWFRGVLQERLGPLLAGTFGEAAVGRGGRRVRIFDAFVVKYTAARQRHLPVHRDQSTHSFTVALNASEEYDGGGTYICDLGQALRPERGHVVAFDGELMHGGDPITRGTRYIVVAFCYTEAASGEEDGEEEEATPASKRAKRAAEDRDAGSQTASIDWGAAAEGGSQSTSFSFGFS